MTRPSWVADKVQKQVGDYKDMYFDGSSGGAWHNKRGSLDNLPWEWRYDAGYEKGLEMAGEIIWGLQRNEDGKIIETVKFVTNSMGAAYQRGFSQALKDYEKSYNEQIDEYNAKNIGPLKPKIEGFEIEFTVDIAAFQGKTIGPDYNSTNNYFMRSKHDVLAGYKGADITDEGFFNNATEINLYTEGKRKGQIKKDDEFGWQEKENPSGYADKYYYRYRHHASAFESGIETIPESEGNDTRVKFNKKPDYEDGY
ncbi:MAG: hypothetical protein AAF734_04515 [Bacteroidota bacterium]